MSVSRASLSPDEVVRSYVDRVRADLEPDPLFRRRLRGMVTNHFVAAREGLGGPEQRSSRMGRLGRACLYASFAVALSVGGALAASRAAVPGDLLYPLKLQVEAIRLETFPEAFQDDLLVYALSERVAEFGRLVEEGDLEGAARLAETIGAGYHGLAERGIDVSSADRHSRVAVLQALSDRLPAPAQAAVERAINEAPGIAGTSPIGGRMTAPAPTSDGAGVRPVVAPIDGHSAPESDPSGAAAPAATSAPASPPQASERPTHGMAPDDEPAPSE